MITESIENKTQRFLKSWVFLACIILFVVFVRVRLSEFPLERDEGEYAYMGQLILQGIPPYLTAYNMKFPGTYVMYALIMSVFGQSIQGIHMGFMIVNCVTILLVFLLARKFVSEAAALVTGAAYALLSLSSSVLGFAGHATHFVVLPALGGVLALLFALRNNKLNAYCWSGFLFGLAFLMKQPGLFFFLFGATYILYHHFFPAKDLMDETPRVSFPLVGNPSDLSGIAKKDCGQAAMTANDRIRISSKTPHSLKTLFLKLCMFTVGGVAPLFISVIYLYSVGAFDKFWFWTFEYASKYGSQIPVSEAFNIFKSNVSDVADGFLFLWIMSLLGLVVMFFYQGMKGKRLFIALFTLFSFLTICPGFYFRSHYFVTLLPAISISIGIFIEWINSRSAALLKTEYARFIGLVIFILAAGAGMVSQKEYLFEGDPVKLSRSVYGVNPFPESIEIAKFIESRSAMTDRIAVLGSEPQIYFYSKRHSATGHIYVYGLMEIHDYSLTMQKEMISEIVSSNPKFIVVVPIATSWLIRPESEKYILRWLDDYVRNNYTLVGVADIISTEKTVYKWHSDVQGYAIRSPYHVLIFEKNRK